MKAMNETEARRSVEIGLARLVELARSTEWANGYTSGYNSGHTDGRASVVVPEYPSVQTVLNRIAGWLDGQQLPLDGAHQDEARLRRRVTAFLRDLAESPDSYHLNGVGAAIERTQ